MVEEMTIEKRARIVAIAARLAVAKPCSRAFGVGTRSAFARVSSERSA